MFRTAGFVVSIVAVVLFAIAPALAQQTDQTQQQGQAAAQQQAQPYGQQPQQQPQPYAQPGRVTSGERAALHKASSSAQAQIEMGQLAQQKSTNNDVKQFAGRIVSDQQQVLSDLRNYASNKNMTLPAQVSTKDRKAIDRLSGLSGTQFDHAFFRDVERQQTAQLNVINNEMRRTTDQQFKDMANTVIPRLQQQQNDTRQQMASMGISTAAPMTDETGQPAKKHKKAKKSTQAPPPQQQPQQQPQQPY